MMGFYSRFIFPRLCDFLMGLPALAGLRREVLADVGGDILEIGFGTGLNLAHYPEHVRRDAGRRDGTGMGRSCQITLIASTIALCWLGMQVVHELGHALAAWPGGEEVHRVVLHPMTISRTDASHDRHPLMVVWGGPLAGAMLPVGLLALTRLVRSRYLYLLRFFAGFCLVANGVYLGVGSFDGVGDAGDLLRYGAPRWSLIAFGLVSVPLGLYLWNGLGRHFGLGEARGRVGRRAALGTLGVLSVVVLIEILVDSR